MEAVILKESVVRFEIYIRSILIVGRIFRTIRLLNAFFKRQFTHFSITKRLDFKPRTQSIDGLNAHTIQSNALLEGFRIIFSTGVKHAHCLDKFALRNASSIVSDTHTEVIFNLNLNAVASLHLEFIDGVIDNFLQ